MFPELARDDVFRLETQRLWLRWPRESDVPALTALAGDWDVAQMTATMPHPYGDEDATRFIVRRARRQFPRRRLALRSDAQDLSAQVRRTDRRRGGRGGRPARLLARPPLLGRRPDERSGRGRDGRVLPGDRRRPARALWRCREMQLRAPFWKKPVSSRRSGSSPGRDAIPTARSRGSFCAAATGRRRAQACGPLSPPIEPCPRLQGA